MKQLAEEWLKQQIDAAVTVERERWKPIVRGLLAYADGHELREPDAFRLRDLRESANRILTGE